MNDTLEKMINQLIQANKELKTILSEQNIALSKLNGNLRKQEEKEGPKLRVGEEIETDKGMSGYALVDGAGSEGEYCILLLQGYASPQYVLRTRVKSLGHVNFSIRGMVEMAHKSIEADSEMEKRDETPYRTRYEVGEEHPVAYEIEAEDEG